MTRDRRNDDENEDSERDRRRPSRRHDERRRDAQRLRDDDRARRHRKYSSESEESEIEEAPRESRKKQKSSKSDSKPMKIPTKVNRSCTDIIFLILFILVLTVWVFVAVITFTQVDVIKVISPENDEGEICGTGRAKNLTRWYAEEIEKCVQSFPPDLNCTGSRKFCIKECPSKSWNETEIPKWDSIVCTLDIWTRIQKEPNETMKEQIYENSTDCVKTGIATQDVFHICMPKPDGNLNVHTDLKNVGDNISNIFMIIIDIYNSVFFILGGLGVALIFGLLWMLSMRFFAGVIVWITTISLPIISGAATAFAFFRAYKLKQRSDGSFDTEKWSKISYLSERHEFFIGIGVVVGLLFLLTCLILLFLRKRIAIAIALIKQASRSISSLPTLVVFPVFPYILQACSIAVTLMVFFLAATLRQQLKGDDNVVARTCSDWTHMEDPNISNATEKFCMGFVDFLRSGYYIYIFNFFAGLWVTFFVSAFSYMVVAHSVARYFWTRREQGTSFMAVGTSVGVAIRYHLGTMAFGSLIVSAVSLVRRILEYIQGKTKNKNPNALVKTILKCCLCCFWMMERFLKYINKNAYIMVAMYGKNFCRSASRAFSLIVSNALRALVVTKVTDFIIFVAKLAVTAGTSIAFFFVMENATFKVKLGVPELYSVFVPVGALAICSFLVISRFFDVYRDAVDTLFLCFLEDKRINDGSKNRPYRMPSELLKILNKRNYKSKKHDN